MKGYSSVLQTIPADLVITGSEYPAIKFKDDTEGTYKGAYLTQIATAQPYIRSYALDSEGKNNGLYSNFFFPKATNSSDSDTKNYEIITTKNRYYNYNIGDCYITSTNTNPATWLGGGTWSLINKSFSTIQKSGTNVINYNSTNVESYETSYAVRDGHSITFKLGFNLTSTSIDDSTIEIGTLNLAELGVSKVTSSTQYLLVSGDGPNGIGICRLSDAGVLSLYDTVVADGADAMTVDGTLGITFTLTFVESQMLDSACEYFIWKRTA